MKRRVRILPPGYLVGTKGHSVLKKKTYVRRPLIEVEEYSKMPTSRRHEYDSGYQLGSFHDARAFSNAVMDDSYDLQSQSRGRDHRLLSHMNDALHTDSPPTSPLLSSRSSKPRNISQLQTKTRRSTRLDTTGTDPSKTFKLSDSLKTSMTSDSYKSSKPSSSLKSSKPLSSLKLSKLSDSFKVSKPYESAKLSKQPEPLKLTKQPTSLKIYKPVEPLIKVNTSDSLQVPKPPEPLKKTKPAESLQLVKVPEFSKVSGLERMSPIVEHARSLLNRQRTFGIDSKLDSIATSAVTSPRDLKSDFFASSPLANYIQTRWPEKESSPLAIEAAPPSKKGIYKNPYLDSDDEEYEASIVLKSNKPRKTGDLLKELRKQRSSKYTLDDESDAEDDVTTKGAYAITKYADDDDEDMPEKPRYSKRYEIEDSPGELALSHLVSTAAIRAKAVLENLTGLLGKGGMINVEGDVKPYGGDVTTFRLHTPFHFQGPLMIGEKPALSVGDDSFERYIFGLQEKRREERNKVEKDSRRITKISRTLSHEAPKQYSLKPIGYISEKNYDSFAKSMVPFQNKFDKPAILSSSKKVHFDEEDEVKKRPTIGFSRELVPFVPKSAEADEMAVVPKRKRYPVYEYTEDIPVKFSIDFPRLDDDGQESKENLSVLEKIRIKVSTDLRRPPKAAVTILRATRRPVLASKPLPPRTTYYPKRKEVPATGPYYPYVSARYIPGRVKRLIARYPSYSSTLDFVDCDETDDLYPRYSTKFRLYDPAYIGRRAVARRPLYRHGYYLPWYSGWRAVARGRYMRSVPSLHHGRVYQLPQPLFKALLVGEDKLDDPDRPRPRKPRTRYYAEKLKKMDDDKEQLSSIMATTPKTRILKASKPPNPYPSYSWRAIREVDGYTRPKNPMYWQYRVESHLEPDDLIHKPSTYGTMRDQVRGVQDKLDRHRQLLDRYRETDLPAAYDPIVHRRHPVLGERIISHADRVVPDLGFVDSHAAGGNLSAGRTSEEGGAADGLGKVSPLRKKLRKVICKSRHNPSYYDE